MGILALLLSTAFVTAQSRLTDEQQILHLEDMLVKAWLRHDVAAVSEIVADDMQYWSFKGARRGKADLLRNVAENGEADTKVEDPIVRVYGDAAVYTARITDSGKDEHGNPFTSRTCVTSFFVRRSNKWQMVADHETLLPN